MIMISTNYENIRLSLFLFPVDLNNYAFSQYGDGTSVTDVFIEIRTA
jgi:hypothetical protein